MKSAFSRLLSLRAILTIPLVLQLLIATGGVFAFVNYGADLNVVRLKFKQYLTLFFGKFVNLIT